MRIRVSTPTRDGGKSRGCDENKREEKRRGESHCGGDICRHGSGACPSEHHIGELRLGFLFRFGFHGDRFELHLWSLGRVNGLLGCRCIHLLQSRTLLLPGGQCSRDITALNEDQLAREQGGREKKEEEGLKPAST